MDQDTTATITAPAPRRAAMRSRHLARFTELETEKDDINGKLAALAKQTSDQGGNPALLDTLPMLGDVLPRLPRRIRQKLLDAFDIQALYSKPKQQVTFWATITPSTPATLAAIIAHRETPDLAQLLNAWPPQRRT